MAVPSSELTRGLITVERDGTTYLGVDTGIAANSPSLRKLAGRRRQTGWIIKADEVTDWKPLGFVERDGRIHVYGPFASGRFFDDALEDTRERVRTTEGAQREPAVAEGLALVGRVAHALATLRRLEVPLSPFHTRTILLLDDGGVLILPPDIMQAIREHQDYSTRIERMERFNHPDRNPNDNAVFAVAAATYAVLTGDYPYDSNDEEELHARVRATTCTPPQHRDVRIRDEVSDATHAELTAAAPARGIEEWTLLLDRWRAEGVSMDLTEDERSRREEAARQAAERVERGFRRKESVRRHGRTALIVATIVVVVGTIPGTIIRNALQPRATAGLPADEVVRTFYTSINDLDHMTMEDAVIESAGADLIREVTHLFVLDRQRMSVEMESGFVDAEQWREAGMPSLPAGRLPYGVTGIELEPLPAPDGEQHFEVRYERWRPDYEESELTGRSGITGLEVVDRVKLMMDKQDWVIYEIDRRSQEPLDLEELRRSANEAA
ncbi:MAG: hypothetical protein ACOC3H_02510 [bacterium]